MYVCNVVTRFILTHPGDLKFPDVDLLLSSAGHHFSAFPSGFVPRATRAHETYFSTFEDMEEGAPCCLQKF